MRLEIKGVIAIGWTFFLTSVLIFGLLVRFSFPEAKSVWSDELFSLALSSPEKSLLSVIEEAFRRDIHPPFYALLLRLYFFEAAYTVEAARTFSAFFGTLGVIAITLFVYLWRNAREALFVGVLLAFNSMLFFYSQEIRMYSLSLFFLGTGMLSWSLGKKNSNQIWFALSGLLFGCLTFTYYIGGLFSIIFISLGVGLAICLRRRFFVPEIVALLTLGIALFFLAPSLFADLQSNQSFWIPSLDIRGFLQLTSGLAGGKFALSLMIGVIAWRCIKRLNLEVIEIHLIFSIGIFSLILSVYSMIFFSVFLPRVLIVLTPLLVVLTGVSVCKLTNSKAMKILSILVFVFPTFLASPNAFDRRGHGHNPKSLVKFIGSNPQRYGTCEKAPDHIRALFKIYGYSELLPTKEPKLQPGTICWLISTHQARSVERLLNGWDFEIVKQKVQAREAAYLIKIIRIAKSVTVE